ncbi:DUF4280 domain-containing protein [Chryseobacterium sp. 1B4]
MSQIITENASLSCDKGVAPSQLKVTSNVFYKADNKLIATEQDKMAAVNISTFGICSVTRIACVPAITKWDNTAEETCINTYNVLTEKSTCACAMGGLITVKDKGHSEQHAVRGVNGKSPGSGKEDKKPEKQISDTSSSSTSKSLAPAAKTVLDDKTVKELKQGAKDFFDTAIALGNLLIRIENVRPKTQKQTLTQTTTQNSAGETVTEIHSITETGYE